MKKRNDFEEFLGKLEEKLDSIMNEADIPGKRPINVSVSFNIIPFTPAPAPDFIITRKESAPIDVLETENNIYVSIGLYGFKPKDIILTCSGKALEVCAHNPEKTLNEHIDLPSRVKRTGIKTIYNNGILELVFNKTKKAGNIRRQSNI